MNIQPAQPIPGNGQQPDQQSLCRCHDMHDCPDQATTLINTAQLARVAELLDVLDGFLRHADGIAHRLADYLHTTRHHPTPPAPHRRRLRREPTHRQGQLHRTRPAHPPPQTATVNTRHR